MLTLRYTKKFRAGSNRRTLPYRKVASSNTSRLEAHADFFQIAYEGDFLSVCTKA